MSTPKRPLVRLVDTLDGLAKHLGAGVSWLTLLMVLVGAYNTLARYVGKGLGLSLGSNAYLELQWYLFSAVFLLGASDALRRDAHVRVDVFYGRLGPAGRDWIDLVGGVLFLVPFCVAGIVLSWPSVASSWAVGEVSPDPGGLPRYPIKTLVPVAFGLLLLQGVAEIARRIARLAGWIDREEDGVGPPEGGG